MQIAARMPVAFGGSLGGALADRVRTSCGRSSWAPLGSLTVSRVVPLAVKYGVADQLDMVAIDGVWGAELDADQRLLLALPDRHRGRRRGGQEHRPDRLDRGTLARAVGAGDMRDVGNRPGARGP